MATPNFVTESFFLAHVAIGFMEKKLEHKYKEVNGMINDSLKDKDYYGFEEYCAFKLCMDVHVFGKGTLALFRSLLSFTNALILCTATGFYPKANSFENVISFLEGVSQSPKFIA